MGVPCLFKEIVRSCPSIMLPFEPTKQRGINYLYIDANSLVYDAVRDLGVDAQTDSIITTTIEKIELLIKLVSPEHLTLVAFDGVVPMGKMIQQRSRRLKRVLEATNSGWDTIQITPGTEFMSELDRRTQSTLSSPTVVISGSNQPGEGEHKIFHHIRENCKPESEIIVYGLDADLILLSLSIVSRVSYVYLLRDTPTFIQSIDPRLHPDTTYLMDITLFETELLRVIGSTELLTAEDIVTNFIFVCSFLGNDFLPHSPSLSLRHGGMPRILEHLRRQFRNGDLIVKPGLRIDWSRCSQFCKALAIEERNELVTLDRHRSKLGRRLARRKPTVNDLPVLDRRIEALVNPSRKGWEERYYWHGLSMKDDAHGKELVCSSYAKTLEWVLRYYYGANIDRSHYFKFALPPLYSDLSPFLAEYTSPELGTNMNWSCSSKELLDFVLPNNQKTNYLDKSDIHVDNSGKHVHWMYARYLWEARVI